MDLKALVNLSLQNWLVLYSLVKSPLQMHSPALGFYEEIRHTWLLFAPPDRQTDRPLSPGRGSPAPRRGVPGPVKRLRRSTPCAPLPTRRSAAGSSRSREPTAAPRAGRGRAGRRDRRGGEAGSPGRSGELGWAGPGPGEGGEAAGLGLLQPSGERCSRRSRSHCPAAGPPCRPLARPAGARRREGVGGPGRFPVYALPRGGGRAGRPGRGAAGPGRALSPGGVGLPEEPFACPLVVRASREVRGGPVAVVMCLSCRREARGGRRDLAAGGSAGRGVGPVPASPSFCLRGGV